jgi:hypothetical protein
MSGQKMERNSIDTYIDKRKKKKSRVVDCRIEVVCGGIECGSSIHISTELHTTSTRLIEK